MGYSLFPCQFSKFCLYCRCGWMREQGKVKLLGGLTVHISIAPHSLCLNLRQGFWNPTIWKLQWKATGIAWLGSAVLMKQQQTDKKKRQPSSSLSSVCWMDFRLGGKGIFSFPRKFGMFLLAAHRMGVTEKLHTNERRASTSDLSLAHKNAVLNAQSAKKYCTTLSHSFSCSIWPGLSFPA